MNNIEPLTDAGSASRIQAADRAAPVCSVSEQRQRPNCHHQQHRWPGRVHAQRPGKGLQAKQSESLHAQDSAIQKPNKNRNNMSHSLYNHPYSTSKMNIRQL